MYVHFIDNTDPEGIARVLATLEGEVGRDADDRLHQERRERPRRATA
jgi:hypothetical protein